MVRWVYAVALCAASSAAADVTGRIDVVDGDTFHVGGVTVRLHGIDAPEKDQTCKGPDGNTWACGAWVTEQVRGAYQGKRTRCKEETVDRYGRSVARCFVRGADVGQRLVQDGIAMAYREYSMAYDLDEKTAAVMGRGLHSSQMQSPAAFRKSRIKGRDAPTQNCAIKGNISKSGRIFHVPGQDHYDRTGINLARGERWFCSVSEAKAAGWRAAKR
ncbi:MAG: thermonuclease family protein [Aliishimia sp.]